MAKHISHGADVEQLDDIAVGLRRQGERIADVGGRGSLLLEKLRALWEGPDFEKFARQWRAAHRHLDEAESAMRVFSRRLADEADSQRATSGVPTSTSRGGSDLPHGRPQAFHRVDPIERLPVPGSDPGVAFDPRQLDLELGADRSRSHGWLRLDEGRSQED